MGKLLREYAPVLSHSKWVTHAEAVSSASPPQMTTVATRPILRGASMVLRCLVLIGFSDYHFRDGLPIARQMKSNVIV